MAHTPYTSYGVSLSSSSSPSVSSPALSKTFNAIGQNVDAIWYRRKEVVDGDVVRIFESRSRCRGHDVGYNPSAAEDVMMIDDANHRVKSKSRNHTAGKSPVVVQSLESSLQPNQSTPTSQQDEGQNRVERITSDAIPSKNSANELFHRSDLPTPPPTPRIRRLPTPDLGPIKERRFCDCCGHLPKEADDWSAESVYANQEVPWW